MRTESSIKIKTPEELQRLREAGAILSAIVQQLKRSLRLGITTKEIDEKAEELIDTHDVRPAFKGYRGFPACVCVSVNEEVVHGIPSQRVLKDGDIVSVDVGIVYRDFFSDTAFTVGLGSISEQNRKLINVTQQALAKGIEQAKVDNHLSDISHAIQQFVESQNFSVVRDFVGHGIGRQLHEEPEIPNYGPAHKGPQLKEGMVLAIEPMVNIGTWQTEVLKDGWTVITSDGQPSAHFEHSVAVTKSGPEILTK